MRLLGALFVWVWLCASSPAETLSPAQFTERFATALQAEIPTAKIAVAGELKVLARKDNGTFADVALDNAYKNYNANMQRFDALVKAYAAALTERVAPAQAKLDLTRIVPVVKTRAWLAELRKTLLAQGAEPVFDDFNGELVVVYAEDSQSRIRYLNATENFGDRKALYVLAIQNLKRILPKIELRQHDDAFALVTAGGDYEASLLLFEDIWSEPQIKVAGDIVVAVPARDVLLVTGSRNRKGLKAVRAMIPEFMKGPQGLSEKLFVYRNGKFVKFGKD
jgi:uncharacterized protein YtpQ (UPF0354 family)